MWVKFWEPDAYEEWSASFINEKPLNMYTGQGFFFFDCDQVMINWYVLVINGQKMCANIVTNRQKDVGMTNPERRELVKRMQSKQISCTVSILIPLVEIK